MSGTYGLAGAADTTIVLLRGRNESGGLIKITGRDVPEGEYAVKFANGSTWQFDGYDLDDAARTARTRANAIQIRNRLRVSELQPMKCGRLTRFRLCPCF